jgi:hypothetical protein
MLGGIFCSCTFSFLLFKNIFGCDVYEQILKKVSKIEITSKVMSLSMRE